MAVLGKSDSEGELEINELHLSMTVSLCVVGWNIEDREMGAFKLFKDSFLVIFTSSCTLSPIQTSQSAAVNWSVVVFSPSRRAAILTEPS